SLPDDRDRKGPEAPDARGDGRSVQAGWQGLRALADQGFWDDLICNAQQICNAQPGGGLMMAYNCVRNSVPRQAMDYITVRELRETSGEIRQRVEAGEEFDITRNGKPFALLVHTEPAAVEDRLRALRLSRMAE